MHVGMAAVFQNTGRALSDHQIYLNELALADMAEPLGFESIWEPTEYVGCSAAVASLSRALSPLENGLAAGSKSADSVTGTGTLAVTTALNGVVTADGSAFSASAIATLWDSI
jgi:hypothetical protein